MFSSVKIAPVSVACGAFINAMDNCVTGVTLVTTAGNSGQFGTTISTMSAISPEPPLLLISLHHNHPLGQAIRENCHFGVNVLSEQQKSIAQRFTGTTSAIGLCSDEEWSTGNEQSPLLQGAIASFNCRLHSVTELGSHTLFIGEVLTIQRHSGMPLALQARQFVLVQRDAC